MRWWEVFRMEGEMEVEGEVEVEVEVEVWGLERY